MRHTLGILALAALAVAQSNSSQKQPATTTRPETVQAVPPGGVIDINTADEKTLSELPGVGKRTARKIIAGRPYASVDEMRHAGVSQHTIDVIRPLVNAAGTDAGIARQAEKAKKKQ